MASVAACKMERRKDSLRNLFQDLGCKVESDAILDKCKHSFDRI